MSNLVPSSPAEQSQRASGAPARDLRNALARLYATEELSIGSPGHCLLLEEFDHLMQIGGTVTLSLEKARFDFVLSGFCSTLERLASKKKESIKWRARQAIAMASIFRNEDVFLLAHLDVTPNRLDALRIRLANIGTLVLSAPPNRSVREEIGRRFHNELPLIVEELSQLALTNPRISCAHSLDAMIRQGTATVWDSTRPWRSIRESIADGKAVEVSICITTPAERETLSRMRAAIDAETEPQKLMGELLRSLVKLDNAAIDWWDHFRDTMLLLNRETELSHALRRAIHEQLGQYSSYGPY